MQKLFPVAPGRFLCHLGCSFSAPVVMLYQMRSRCWKRQSLLGHRGTASISGHNPCFPGLDPPIPAPKVTLDEAPADSPAADSLPHSPAPRQKSACS